LKIFSYVLLLAMGLNSAGCKKDDEEDVKTPEGDNAQDQVYTENLDPNKPLLVVYGDSLSTGVLSNTTLGKNPDSSLTLQLADYLKEQEFNATGFQSKLSNLDIAASSTKEPYGLRASVGAQSGVTAAEVGLVSFAKFGAKARDLPAMFNRWKVENANTIQKKPDSIFIMLGGNDFCSDISVEDILRDYNEQTTAIYNDSPASQIIIAPAPPIDQLPAIDFTYGPALQGITGEELSCRKFRDNLCKRVNGDPAEVKARITAINAGIQAQAEALKAQGAKIVFVDQIMSWQLKPEEFAVDCFHPSALGQQTIGNLVKDALSRK
jgi:lysophospholipase L1-like esterase